MWILWMAVLNCSDEDDSASYSMYGTMVDLIVLTCGDDAIDPVDDYATFTNL